jgi:hypothetical protein
MNVGIEEDDDEPFWNKMERHTSELAGQIKKSKGLEEKRGKNL